MNEMQIFNSAEFGTVRTLEIDGVAWFVGKDVAEALGYVKPLDALSRHVDEDDSVKHGLIDNMGRMQETILINESGLYSLVLSSKLPTAKKFKRWVTSEVLPAIRKHGSYSVPQVPQMSQAEIIAAMANNAVELEKRINEQGKAILSTNQRIDDMCEIMKPVSDDWRPAMNKLVSRIAEVAEYPIDELRVDIYDEVDIRGGVHLETRLKNVRRRMLEQGVRKTSADRINKLDVISQDKKLIAIYVAVVREFAAKYIA